MMGMDSKNKSWNIVLSAQLDDDDDDDDDIHTHINNNNIIMFINGFNYNN